MSAEPKQRILIVDDNEAIHEDFRKILALHDRPFTLDAMASELFGSQARAPAPVRPSYLIVSAYQGEQALCEVQEGLGRDQSFAVAFIDMRMPPGWDGLQTTEKIWTADPDIQVVICTAYSDYSWEDILAKFGVSDRLLILKKPFDPAEVCQMACALTEKWRLAKLSRR